MRIVGKVRAAAVKAKEFAHRRSGSAGFW